MQEPFTYTDFDFTDLASLMQELSSNIVFTRESLDRMLADPNSHLYVIREDGRIVASVACTSDLEHRIYNRNLSVGCG